MSAKTLSRFRQAGESGAQTRPVALQIPPHGIVVAESRHGASFQMDAEMHAFYELYVVYRGGIRYAQGPDWTPMPLNAGSVALIGPEVPHRMEDDAQSVLLLLGLSPAFMEAGGRAVLWRQMSQRASPAFTPNPVVWHGVVSALRRILAEQGRPGLGSGLLVAADADRLLVELARVADGGTAAPGSRMRVQQVAAQVKQQYYETWDLDQAAAMAQVSRRRFTALFREHTGQTFIQYLNAVRIRKAGQLLREGRHSVTGVAFACGINDPGHFYRLFKAAHGMSPGAWMAGNGASERPGNTATT